MKDSMSGFMVGLAMVVCCALPILFLSAAAFLGGGLVLNQQALLGVGLLLVFLGIGAFLLIRRRNR